MSTAPVLQPAPEASAKHTSELSSSVGRLTVYFGLVYLLQGVCQLASLLNQPLRSYLREVLKYDAGQSAWFFWVVGLPWTIKPLYGLLSDFVPILGYRRKTYLLLFNLVAAGCFLWISGQTDPTVLMIAGVAVGVGVAAADVIVDALMVQAGRETGLAGRFQSVQWACMYIASLASSVGSAALLRAYGPTEAVRWAALICVIPPVAVALVTWWFVPERRTKLNLVELNQATRGLLAAFASPLLWFVLAFLVLLWANPGLVTPLNYHMTTTLQLSDEFVAGMDGVFSIGAIVGAGAFYLLTLAKPSMRRMQVIGILVGAAGMLPYFAMQGQTSAVVASLTWGFGYMVGNLATLSLAAAACPKRAEAFVFAALMSAGNFASSQADVWGSQLYEGPCARDITPLLWLSVGLTLAGLLFVPFIPKRLDRVAPES